MLITLLLASLLVTGPARAATHLGVAREGVTEEEIHARLPWAGIERVGGSRGTYVLDLPSSGAAGTAIRESLLFQSLEQDGAVEVPPAPRRGTGPAPRGLTDLFLDPVAPRDPDYPAQWALQREGPGIGAVEAWRRRTSSGDLIVAVLDSGVDLTHPDLAANLWVNEGEIPANGRDDDGNGFIDDVHGADTHFGNGNPQDGVGHGTLCAGIIGAVGGNGVGGTGVLWRTRIMAVRAEDGTKRMSYSGVVRGGYYAAAMGAAVINGSWGTYTPSPTVKAMIEEIGERGVILVNAVGNRANDLDRQYPEYPAAYRLPNVITVTATTDRDELVHYADRGERSVDLGAPGWKIVTTALGGGTTVQAGTSVAAPFVTAAVAMLRAEEPALTAEEVKRRILGSVDPLPALAGVTVSGGRLNLGRALEGR